jgi:hypothetical protein
MVHAFFKDIPYYKTINIDFRSNFEYISEFEIKSTIDFNVLKEMYIIDNCKSIHILPYHEPFKKKINFDFIVYSRSIDPHVGAKLPPFRSGEQN